MTAPSSISSCWRSTWAIPDRRPIYDWGHEKIRLPAGVLTVTGQFDVTSSRHLIGPFDALQDDRVREVNVLAPVRGGKTLIADIWVPWIIENDPGPLVWFFQDDKAADDQAELRTWPIFLANPIVRDRLPANRHKARGKEIIFAHMPFHIKGPAESNLQSRGWRYVIVDEPWLLKPGKLEQARGRLGDYVKLGNDKFLCLAQGGFTDHDWERQCSRALTYNWHVQCERCDHYMQAVWTGRRADGSIWGIRWDTHRQTNGLWDVARCVPTVRFECEKCAHPHIWSARTRAEWNRTGQYIAEPAERLPTRKTFHWTAVIDYPWDQLLEIYLNARNAWKLGVVEPLIIFFQKRMAEHASERALLENKINFRKASYAIATTCPEGRIRLLTADRQAEDVYWVVIREWEIETGKSWRIWFGKCYSDAEIEEKRKEHGVESNHTLIDSGYRPKGDHGVYRSCIRYGWTPLKGEATEGGEPRFYTHRGDDGETCQRTYSEPILVDSEIGTADQDERYAQMIRFSSPTYADRLENLNDRGLWFEPEGLDDDPLEQEYRRQNAAEYKRAVRVGNKSVGKVRHVWVCPSGNNHAKDCNKMQVLGATLLEILPDLEETPAS